MSFLRCCLGVNGSHIINSTSCFSKFHVGLLLAAISGIQKSTRFFKLAGQGICLALSQTSLFSDLHLLSGFFFQERLGVSKLALITFNGLVSLSISLVRMIQSNFKFIDVRF